MSKHPEPSRPSMSRPGSGLPDPADTPPITKLKTVTPKLRRSNEDSNSKPVELIRREEEAKSALPNVLGPQPVDPSALDLFHQTIHHTGSPDENGFDEDEAITIRDQISRHRNPLSSLIASTAVHVILLLALAVIVFNWPQPERTIGLVAEIVSEPVPEQPNENNTETVIIELPEDTESPVDDTFEEMTDVEKIEVANTENVTVPSVIESEDTTPAVEEQTPVPTKVETKPTGGGLQGRDANARANLAAKRGGSAASEIAVENGLRWIIAHQRDDGSWHLKHDHGQCNGQCRNEGTQESTTAATGLALLAILGAGYTNEAGPYQEEVQAGLTYLISQMRVSAHGGNLRQGEKGMYAHAIATIALSEAYILTGDTEVFAAVVQARKYIEASQHKKGGWRYNPGSLGDLSVTGWQIMALKSCEQATLKTGEITWQRAQSFVDSLGSSSGRYGYQKPAEDQPTMTAVGLLSQIYLGAKFQDPGVSAGSDYLANLGPDRNDIYYNYHATLVLHHRQGEGWQMWNEKMRDYLVKTQDQTTAHSAGSWHFPHPHGDVGGRLYSTAMAIMTLEVYYRYMPMYGHRD